MGEIVEILLNAGLDPHEADSMGRNAFHTCILSPFCLEYIGNDDKAQDNQTFESNQYCICWLKRFCSERAPLPNLPPLKTSSSSNFPDLESYQQLWIGFWTNLLIEMLNLKLYPCSCDCSNGIKEYCPCIATKNRIINYKKNENNFFNILINILNNKKKNLLKNYKIIDTSISITTNDTIYCILLLLYSSLIHKKNQKISKFYIDNSLYLKHDIFGYAPIHYISLFNYSYIYSILLRNIFEVKNILVGNTNKDILIKEKWYNDLEIENSFTIPPNKVKENNLPKLIKKILISLNNNLLDENNNSNNNNKSPVFKYVKTPLLSSNKNDTYFLTNIYSDINRKRETFCDISLRLSCNELINFLSGFSNSLGSTQNIIKVKQDQFDEQRMMKIWEKFFENAIKFSMGESLESDSSKEKDEQNQYDYDLESYDYDYNQTYNDESYNNEYDNSNGEWVFTYNGTEEGEWIWVTTDGRVYSSTYGWYLNDGWLLVMDESGESYYHFFPTGYSVWDPPEGWDDMVKNNWNGWILCAESSNIDYKFW